MRSLFWLILFAVPTLADDPAPKPAEADIQLPVIVVPPAPVPPVDPAAIPKLPADTLYVITSKVECVIRAHPAGLVSITKKKGPRDITAVFIDSAGKSEDRTFAGPFIYVVKASGVGKVDLDVIPLGLKAEKDIVSQTLDVNNGTSPIPPPVPPTPPVPPGPVPVTSFHVFIVRESGTTHTAAQMAVMDGKAVQDYLAANCTVEGTTAGWRRYDPQQDTTNENPAIKTLWAAVQPKLTALPCIVIEANGKADILPLSATPAEQVAVLKKYHEGK